MGNRAGKTAWKAGAVVVTLFTMLTQRVGAVPSFARQTGLACQACHTVFPELTPFGRLFKLNGYQIDNLPQVQGVTSSNDTALVLNQIPPLSFMLQASHTRTSAALPDSAVSGALAQNGQVLFPQQASLFYAGRIAPHLGSFVQITYDGATGSFGLDNTEIRFARQVGGVYGVTYGATFNNNPTVQDVWNSTPAWQMPFDQQTSAAPTPGAATQVDGALADRGVFGATGYVWIKHTLYGEAGIYRSAPQGFEVNGQAGPLDSTAGGVITGAAPYWRVAAEHQWDKHSVSAGVYGLTAKLSGPDQPVGAPVDKFRDAAIDGQYQFVGDPHIFSVQTTFIDEHQTLDASVAAGVADDPTNDLKTFRLGGSYYFRRMYGAAFGVFSTTGSSDQLLYQPGPVSGFSGGSPDSHGWLGELNYVPWQNVRLVVQYVSYGKFNGARVDYDGAGRSATANSTLYVLGWVAF